MTHSRVRSVPFGKPVIDEATIDAVAETLRSGWIGAGPQVERFEVAIADLAGSRFAVAVTSATAGLEVALRVAGIGPGDEVITSAFTFVATANAIIHTGATPVLVDVEPGTRNINPTAVDKAISGRTRAVMPVHFAGLPCDMEAISSIADRHGLVVIDDAAHALGASVNGKPVGVTSALAVFSFGPSKNVTTIQGGAITTDEEEWAAAAATFCDQGLASSAWSRAGRGNLGGGGGAALPGHNYRMTDVAATIGLAGVKRFSTDHRRREAIWQRYDESFADLPLEVPAAPPAGTVHGRQYYSPLVDRDARDLDRDSVRQRLNDLGVGTGVHYLPVHHHPFYRNRLGVGPGDLPHSDDLWARTFTLPLSAHLTDEDVDHVIAAVRSVCAA